MTMLLCNSGNSGNCGTCSNSVNCGNSGNCGTCGNSGSCGNSGNCDNALRVNVGVFKFFFFFNRVYLVRRNCIIVLSRVVCGEYIIM